MRIRAILFIGLFPATVFAQQPLSVIDWLNENSGAALPGTVIMETPVAEQIVNPVVEVRPLSELSEPLGLVPSSVTGLPVDLWMGSEIASLTDMLADVPVRNSPAMQALLYSLLLSETRPPDGAEAEDLTLARIDRLVDMGAVEPALALTLRAGPTASRDLFQRWFDTALLTGQEDKACAALLDKPHLSPGYDARVFCTARTGDWNTAALTLENAHVLELLPKWKLDLLDRFLSPEIFEGAPPLPDPAEPDALAFRMHEAIGERLSARGLPLAFATADLRDVAGWKAQIEAAERLSRMGAVGANQLLGLYTVRLPAASGGVWDRVDALQRFETALNTRSPDAVAKSLPLVWSEMERAGLGAVFAEMFADALAAQKLTDPAAKQLAWRIRLLSSGYETAAHYPPDDNTNTLFLAALAKGDPNAAPATDPTTQAISEGFSDNVAIPPAIRSAIDGARLGEAILMAMELFDSGASGNPADLTRAIAAFRMMGLEDTARRASLQLMLLGHG